MKKEIVKIAFVVMCLMFVIGIIFIFSASSIGRNAGNKAIIQNGGQMDTNQFQKIIDETTISYQMGGFVISLVGGIGLLLSGYVLYRET